MERLVQKINDHFYIDKGKELGSGNYGTVYKGYYLTENKIIAIKFIHRDILNRHLDYKRQLKVMESLTKIRHPHIMDYYGHHQIEKGLYCFLEFCSGGSLKQLIQKDNKISQIKVVRLYKQILSAMAYMNQLKLLHRDLKPQNILLDQNGDIKIADFGLSRQISISMTQGVCTPLYAAPQVLNEQPYDQKCDVWSVGLILYEMLTGEQYFQHVNTKKQLIKQCDYFKENPNKIVYFNGLNELWGVFTNMMLTYSPLERRSFAEIQSQFEKAEGKLKGQLAKRYGESCLEAEMESDVTKSASPYLTKANNQKMTIQIKLQEEISYTNLVQLRKYLSFYRLKSQILLNLAKQFNNNNNYDCLKNVYKYVLVFLSISAYISRITNQIQQLNIKKINTPDGIISDVDFTQEHLIQVSNLIKQFSGKYTQGKKKMQKILQKQITQRILNTYNKRQSQKKIIENICKEIGDVQNLINRSLNGDFDTEDTYISIYKEIMNHQDVWIETKKLSSFSENDLKTYALIRMIGNLNQIFIDGFYKQDDYIRIRMQDIENRKGQSLLQLIRTWN